jgi:hypothetical protein
MDTVMKVLRLGPAVEGTVALGYPVNTVLGIGIAELVCLALYLTPAHIGPWERCCSLDISAERRPRTSASRARCSHTPLSDYVALFVWGGLYLRESRLRELVPFRR